MEKYAQYELTSTNVFLNPSFEFFKDIRMKERSSAKIMTTIVSWTQIAKSAFESQEDKDEMFVYYLYDITLLLRCIYCTNSKQN